jgi:hypothetical protein
MGVFLARDELDGASRDENSGLDEAAAGFASYVPVYDRGAGSIGATDIGRNIIDWI